MKVTIRFRESKLFKKLVSECLHFSIARFKKKAKAPQIILILLSTIFFEEIRLSMMKIADMLEHEKDKVNNHEKINFNI